MKRRTAVLIAILLSFLFAAPAASASGKGRSILDFDVMAPVSEPFTGPTNAIRGVPGGGAPWEIDEAKGELRSDGRLEVRVEGLVLARRAPVPPERQGTNPVPSFKAIVSCLTATNGTMATANVSTALVPASPSGDARIRTRIDVPRPCYAPIVFVTSPDGAWFSVTGR